MKKSTSYLKIVWIVLCLFLIKSAFAQNIGINEDGSNPDPSAILDVVADDKGLLIPRLTAAEKLAISSPAEGLMVYDTTEEVFYYFKNAIEGWLPIGREGTGFWRRDGNAGTLAGTDFLGTTDAQDLVFVINGMERFRMTTEGQFIIPSNEAIRIGYNAGNSNTDGSSIYVGSGSGQNITTGMRNTSLGQGALNSTTSGNDNVAIGYNTLTANTTGYQNIAIGQSALENVSTSDSNIGIGYVALRNTTGSHNIALGERTLEFNDTGYNNVGIGRSCLSSNTVGNSNVAIGQFAMSSATSGTYNVAIGGSSLLGNTTGNSNIAFGLNALLNNEDGSNNFAAGASSLEQNIGGVNNLAIGHLSLQSNTSGSYNLAFGSLAMQNNSIGFENIAFGRQSLYENVNGHRNIAIGYFSLTNNESGDSNVAIGQVALENSITGSGNLALGREALRGILAGSNNIALGTEAGENITSGSRNIIIGNNINAPIDNTSNQLNIGNIIYGTNVNGTGMDYSSGYIGIKNNNPTNDLHVGLGTGDGITIGSEDIDDEGTFLLEVDATWRPQTNGLDALGGAANRWSVLYAVNGTINTSDRRLKKNITELDYGLNEILKLKPVSFEWKDIKGDGKKLGLIAQDLQEVIPEVVKDWEWAYEREDRSSRVKKEAETMGVYYSDLIPVLIKAIQEQNENIKKLESRIKDLENH